MSANPFGSATPGFEPGPIPGAEQTDQRDGSGMPPSISQTADVRPQIDIGRALDLLATAVGAGGEWYVYPPVWSRYRDRMYAAHGGPQCLVGRVLSLTQVPDEALEELRDRGLRELYSEGKLPVRLTLGTLAVLDAAERSQDRGYSWGDALDYATDVATSFLDLLPDAALHAAGDRVDAPEPGVERAGSRPCAGGRHRG